MLADARTGPAAAGAPRTHAIDLRTLHAGAQCEQCGQPARVHVLEGYRDGLPVQRHLCPHCSERDLHGCEPAPAPRDRPTARRLLGCCGLALLALAIGGDYLALSNYGGFGKYQQSGLVIGAVLLAVGLLLRADYLALGGVALAGAAMLMDRFGAGAGFGWKQQVLVVLAAGLVVVTLAPRLRRALRPARGAGAPAAPRPEPHA